MKLKYIIVYCEVHYITFNLAYHQKIIKNIHIDLKYE